MSFFQRAATVLFSLLLHASLAAAAFLFASSETLPEEKAYRVSLAEFAPAQSITPEREEKADSAPAEPQPEAAPPPPKPAPVAAKPARPKPKPEKRTAPQQTREAGGKTEQAPPQGPRAIGGLSAYAEDAVDQRPSISRRVLPEYPDRARRMNMQGQVIVQLVVDVSGEPRQCAVYSSDPAGVFDEAALAAARRTRFLPGKVRGQPVNTIVLIPYRFSLR